MDPRVPQQAELNSVSGNDTPGGKIFICTAFSVPALEIHVRDYANLTPQVRESIAEFAHSIVEGLGVIIEVTGQAEFPPLPADEFPPESDNDRHSPLTFVVRTASGVPPWGEFHFRLGRNAGNILIPKSAEDYLDWILERTRAYFKGLRVIIEGPGQSEPPPVLGNVTFQPGLVIRTVRHISPWCEIRVRDSTTLTTRPKVHEWIAKAARGIVTDKHEAMSA
ncbi:hypothetical protein QBC39DRAFT_138100 [Podospora conica]|nr:hypothetical protein QBC39DRAFT_138100 [Schizothecium conicum]